MAMTWWAVGAVVVVVVGLLATAANAGRTTVCTGSLGAVTVEGDVDVPTGAACSLLGTSNRERHRRGRPHCRHCAHPEPEGRPR